MDLRNLLESIGLTKQEAKCYIALYQLKEAKQESYQKNQK